jgi:hypothetical protein
MTLPVKMTSAFDVQKYWRNRNSKSQITSIKWFDKLTTLSQVKGQITTTKIQKSKPVLIIWYWNLRFVCNLVLGNWGPARRVACPKDQFDILQCSITPA